MELKDNIVWQTRPSGFLYAGSYIVAAIVIYFAIQMEYAMTSSPVEMVMYAPWSQPLSYWSLNDWPLLVVLLCDLIIVIMLISVVLKILKTRFTQYLLMNDQLVVRKFIGLGVVEYRTEMYRMVDFMQVQMAMGGVFGFSTITLRSTDAIMPVVKLEGVRNANRVIELLRTETEQCRQKKRIQEFVSPQMSPPPGRNMQSRR